MTATTMQSPAEFSREHQPVYVPATNRVLAGFLTMGVYALVLVVAAHRNPAPNHAARSEITTRMERDTPQETRKEAFQQTLRQTSQQTLPNTPQSPVRQQSASHQPSFLERLFGTQTSAPIPTMTPTMTKAPTMTSGATPGPSAQPASAAQPSSGAAPAGQLASAPSASGAKSSSLSAPPGAPGQQEGANKNKDKPPACYDAAWAQAVTNHVRRFFPPAARRPHATGVATARLVIRRSGWLNELEIAKTSGNAALDDAAYKILRKARPLPRIPDRVISDRIDLELPIAFGAAGDFKVTIAGCG